MALDPQLLEILACPEDKGPLLYFEDEDALYNPRLQAALRASRTTSRSCSIDEAETVDDAEHERLLAKAEAEGIEPDLRARRDRRHDPTRRGDRHARACSTPPPACPSRSRRPSRPARRSRACPTATTSRTSSCSAWAAAASPATCSPPWPGRSCPVPVVVAKGYDAPSFVGDAHARVRHVVLGRHRGDRRGGRRGRRRRGAGMRGRLPAAAQLAELAASSGARRSCRVPDGIPMPRAGLGRAGRPAARRARADRPVPGRRRRGSTPPSTQLAPPARPARRRRATRPPSWPGASAARCRSSTAAAPSARWPPPGGRPRSTRTPRCRRSPTPCPSSATTRSAAGASTATSPARCSRWCSAPRRRAPAGQAAASTSSAELLDEVVGGRPRGAGRGRGRAGPAARPGPRSATSSASHLAAQEGLDPGPGPGPRRDQGRPRPRLRPPTIEIGAVASAMSSQARTFRFGT